MRFFNIYHQHWALIEQKKTLMHCENTTFSYNNNFKEYMKVEGALPEDIFYYLFDIGAENFLSEKEKNISLNYLRNGIQSIVSNLMKILMIIQIMMV